MKFTSIIALVGITAAVKVQSTEEENYYDVLAQAGEEDDFNMFAQRCSRSSMTVAKLFEKCNTIKADAE
jgi:hypothetical protein